MPVLAAILVLAVLIVVHELGHFLAARLQGIYVNRFSLGFGPTLLKYQGKETEYAVRAFPLGGYVAFPDDDPDSEIPADDPNLLRNRPILDRAIVISAGVIANLVFAYFLLVGQIGLMGIQELSYQPGVLIPQVASDVSTALAAGIKPGDIVLLADGQPLKASQDAVPKLRDIIQNHPNQEIKLSIERKGQPISISITPEASPDGKGRIGVQLAPNAKVSRRKISNPLEVLSTAATEYQRVVLATVQGFGQLISNFGETADQVAGPVKIVELGASIAQSNVLNLLQFAAVISINLAIINILPLPALDGGQLAFLLVEGLRGRPLPGKIQDGIMQTGLMLLLGLGIFLIIRDTANLTWVQQLLQ